MARLLIIFFVLSLSACVTVGNKFDISNADKLKPSISTESDAIGLLGAPTARSYDANKNELLQWQYSRGSLAGGSGAHLAILFDANGKMIRITHRFQL